MFTRAVMPTSPPATGTASAAMLSIRAALDFWKENGLQTFRDHAHSLVSQARRQLLELDDTGPLFTPDESDFVSMAAVELPRPDDWEGGYHGHPDPLQTELAERFQIEIPVGSFEGRRFIRVSSHLYNSEEDIARLMNALSAAKCLRETR